MQTLIENIEDYLKSFCCIRPNRTTIDQVLKELKIDNAYNFGKHYSFNEPFRKFATDYKNFIFRG